MVERAHCNGCISWFYGTLCNMARIHGSRLLDFLRFWTFCGSWPRCWNYGNWGYRFSRTQPSLFNSNRTWRALLGPSTTPVAKSSNVHLNFPSRVQSDMLLLSQGILSSIYATTNRLCSIKTMGWIFRGDWNFSDTKSTPLFYVRDAGLPSTPFIRCLAVIKFPWGRYSCLRCYCW